MIWWQQCNLCNGSNVETAVSRRNSWKTNYIIALLKMKALSLIPILVDLSSAVIPISLYINYIDMTELRSTGFHHQMLITGHDSFVWLYQRSQTDWFIHLFYFTIELLFTTKGKWNHLFLFNRKTSKFTFSTEDIELQNKLVDILACWQYFPSSWWSLTSIGEVQCCVMIARKPQSWRSVIKIVGVPGVPGVPVSQDTPG